jgi:hypothetical protein
LEELNLSWPEAGKVQSDAGSSDDGGGFGHDENWRCYILEGVVDAVNSFAFASTAEFKIIYGPPVSRIFIVSNLLLFSSL